MSKRLSLLLERGEDESAGTDISTLVDVAFLLLIYFLVTSTLMPKEAGLGIHLFGEEGTGKVVLPPLTIGLDGEGRVLLDGSVIEEGSGANLPRLAEELKRHREVSVALDNEPAVVILAADEAGFQRLVDVMNEVTGAGILRVTFGADWKEKGREPRPILPGDTLP